MNRFFVEKSQIDKDTIRVIGSDEVHHMVKVLRIKIGEDVFISDGDGAGYIATCAHISSAAVDLKIKEVRLKKRRQDRALRITLACAVPKLTSFEDIVDKTTQLEVDEIIPLFTERTIIEREDFEKKWERLERIRMAAAKQSGVLFLPLLRRPETFDHVLEEVSGFDLCLIPNLSKKSVFLRDAAGTIQKGRVLVFIGPEGDFTEREIKDAFRAGCLGVDLGGSVLRVATAAIAVVSFLKLYYEK